MVPVSRGLQWIAGSKLMLWLANGASIAIDLTEAEQSSYQAWRKEGITVGGTEAVRDGRRPNDALLAL